MMWGGWTCGGCGTELDARARPLDAFVQTGDAAAFTSSSPRRMQLLVALPLITLVVSGLLWALVPVVPLPLVAVVPFLVWMGTFIALHVLSPSTTLVVSLHGLRYGEHAVPYAHVQSVERQPQGLTITTDRGTLTVAQASDDAQRALLDALDRFRRSQAAGDDATAAKARLTELVEQR